MSLRILLALSLLLSTYHSAVAEPPHGHDGEDSHSHGDEHGHDEGSAEISIESFANRGIAAEVAGPRSITRSIQVNARISANNDAVAHLHPRFAGVVKEARKQVGERVSKGEVLAVIESNQSLQRYEVSSLTDGTILYRHATLGEFVDESRPIFVVADLSTVWADLSVFPRDFSQIHVGQGVTIRPPYKSDTRYDSTISFTSSVVDQESQARIARAVVDNPRGELLPDQYVDAAVVLDAIKVDIAVRNTALQRIEDATIVFLQKGDTFLAQPVTTGRSDGDYTEILTGLKAGATYAFGNTFLLKAELGKSSAAHEH
jgi:cobalt-zinc-cadmium efflux system membrane fusion protein